VFCDTFKLSYRKTAYCNIFYDVNQIPSDTIAVFAGETIKNNKIASYDIKNIIGSYFIMKCLWTKTI